MADSTSFHLIAKKIFICFSFISLSAACGSAQNIQLSNQLVNVQCSENAWMQYAKLAQARQLGFAKQPLPPRWSNLKDITLPPAVEEAIQFPLKHAGEWLQCVFDTRATNIQRLDVLGQPVPDGDPVLCSDAAIAVLAKIVPLGPQEPDRGSYGFFQGITREIVNRWAREAEHLAPNARMQLWHQRASVSQRHDFLLLAMQLPSPNAFTLVEQDFMKRARKSPNMFLELEVGAYCRHRRSAAKDFFEKYAQCRADAIKNVDFHNQINRLLTGGDTLEVHIERFLRNGEGLDELYALLRFSIDRPWAYHSMKVEPTSMGIPILERQLQTLIGATLRTDDCGKRIQLLDAADDVVDTLKEVVARSNLLERNHSLRLTDPQGMILAKQLSELLTDKRPAISSHEVIQTPAAVSAKLIWQLWGPHFRLMDVLYRDAKHDWWGQEIDLLGFSTNDLLIEVAPKIVAQEIAAPKPITKQAITSLSNSLLDNSAEQMREKLASLSWEIQLLIAKHAVRNKRLLQQMQKYQRTWLDLDTDAPQSLQELWTDDIANHQLHSQAYTILVDWLASQARQGHYWSILAESQRLHMGLRARVIQSAKIANTAAFDLRNPVHTPHIYASVPSSYSNFRCVIKIGEHDLTLLHSKQNSNAPEEIGEYLKKHAADRQGIHDGLQVMLIALPSNATKTQLNKAGH